MNQDGKGNDNRGREHEETRPKKDDSRARRQPDGPKHQQEGVTDERTG